MQKRSKGGERDEGDAKGRDDEMDRVRKERVERKREVTVVRDEHGSPGAFWDSFLAFAKACFLNCGP